MRKYNINALFIIVMISTIAAIFGYGNHKSFKAAQSLNHKLDSLNVKSAEIEAIRKTITIAYPNVGKDEAIVYAYMFYNISSKYKNVDPIAFAALIKIESGWNPTLVSSKECRGMTQLQSSTAEAMCKQLGIEYKKGVTEWNDVLNIILGLNYFSSRYESHNLSYAIKSYIGGDGFSNATSSNKAYIERYSNDFINEYRKLYYIHKGVQYEASLLKKLL